MRIAGMRGLGMGTVFKQAVVEFGDDDMSTYASALAFQILFSLFPFIVFLIALLGVLQLSPLFDLLRGQAAVILPLAAMEEVNKVISEIQQPSGGMLSLGMVLAIWAASSAVRATMDALNVAYDVNERRPTWKLYSLSIIYTVGFAALLIVVTGLLVTGPTAMQWLTRWSGLDGLVAAVWVWLRWPAAMVTMCFTIALVYYVGPNIKQEFRFITPGAVLAVTLWIVASLGFNLYLQNFANYSATYGSIGTIIGLLMYFYISAAVMLLGAEVNSVIEHYTPAAERAPEINAALQDSRSGA
ncbi:MAG: YihY/virulence factor BrkB family protein [Herminiimonas sp.]|nr:YihY/virulence factor BrkB family protein [Herminiimonas sp.]MDB5854886.1 YihY/virulence factor BrkB family protein [Herminiimonas sp.]